MKKLLAVVLSAAMVLGMGATAFASDEAAGVAATPGLAKSEDGLTVYVTTEGTWNTLQGSLVLPEGAEVEKAYNTTDLSMAAIEQMLTGVPASNVDGNEFLFAAAYTDDKGAGIEFSGNAFYVTFVAGSEGEVVLKAADGTELDTIELGADEPAPTEDVPASEEPAPTDDTPASEAPAPTDDTAASQAPTGGTGSQTPSGSTGSTGTGTGAGKTTAAKTADVAPVATMALLALAAGVVVVSMKKKVTE